MTSQMRIADMEAAATLLTLMGNERRLVILNHLVEREMPVGVIAEEVGLSQSALSQHLAKLRAAGLVETRRDRQMIYYSCRSHAVRGLLCTLSHIFVDGVPVHLPDPGMDGLGHALPDGVEG